MVRGEGFISLLAGTECGMNNGHNMETVIKYNIVRYMPVKAFALSVLESKAGSL